MRHVSAEILEKVCNRTKLTTYDHTVPVSVNLIIVVFFL